MHSQHYLTWQPPSVVPLSSIAILALLIPLVNYYLPLYQKKTKTSPGLPVGKPYLQLTEALIYSLGTKQVYAYPCSFSLLALSGFF